MGVINRLRGFYEARVAPRLAALLSKATPNPNVYTLASPVAAAAAIPAWLYASPAAGLLLIALSLALDAVDGAVARFTGRASLLGSFLDSSLDRVSDTLYHVALYIAGVHPLVVMAMLSGGLIVPYLRAKGESLGLEVRGRGVMERGERSLAILAILAVSVYNIQAAEALAIAVAALVWITVAQRTIYIVGELRG
ncbi:archaetidylinositol phosphate synthase [Aeropyrum camini]|uniref:CDP-alcohol phosphatidyltransferase n=1 Tax=Aeropyrum camini SY1 = JCM 12091 TaxID=1198449 RepID=U3TEN7_9CREN|nr:archaetidylinositol phosphate synthase [Aeropyrum camini]BAN90428.1 CDP-alcohol phosphatidyltransferase [Aeropyrum camini SY1 = JCM 12091]